MKLKNIKKIIDCIDDPWTMGRIFTAVEGEASNKLITYMIERLDVMDCYKGGIITKRCIVPEEVKDVKI